MKKIIKITESDLTRIVKRVLSESDTNTDSEYYGETKDRYDFKHENKPSLLVRKLYQDTGIPNYGLRNFKSLIYGYDNDFEKRVVVRYNELWPKKITRENRYKPAQDESMITLTCSSGNLSYTNIKTPSQEQQDLDKYWLETWCQKIDWSSKLQKKRLFKKEKNRSAIKD